jgi:hypothetical protein
MTKCPACGRRIRASDPSAGLSCSACGWGTGRPASVPEPTKTERRPVRPASPAHVLMLWLAASVIVAIAAWIVFGLAKVRPTDEHVLIFAGCLVGYAAFGYVVQPAADAEGSEWLFGGFFDKDEDGLGCVALSFALFPGRVIGLAFVHTVCLIRQRQKQEPGPPLSGRF